MQFTVVLSQDPRDGGYSASCPAAPGALGSGETREAALADIRRSVELWIEVTEAASGQAHKETAGLVAAEIVRILGFREEAGWDRSIETATVTIPRTVAV